MDVKRLRSKRKESRTIGKDRQGIQDADTKESTHSV